MRELINLRTFTVAIAIALMLAAAGCAERVDVVIDLLKANGFDVGEKSEEELVFVGAPHATGVDVNGQRILIYRFSKPENVRDGVEATEDILKAGTGFWEVSLDPIEDNYYTKGEFLIFLGGHPDSERIRKLLDDKL